MRLIPRAAEEAQTTRDEVGELARRESGGVEVLLLWDRRSNRLTLQVVDAGSGDWVELPVESAHALDAFRHPYAYAARSGVAFLPPAPELALLLPD